MVPRFGFRKHGSAGMLPAHMQCAEFAKGSRAPGGRVRRGDRRRTRRIAVSTAGFAPPQGSRQKGPKRVRGITQTGEVADANRHQAGTGAGHAHRWEVPLRGLQSPRPFPPCSGARTTGPHTACHHRRGAGHIEPHALHHVGNLIGKASCRFPPPKGEKPWRARRAHFF